MLCRLGKKQSLAPPHLKFHHCLIFLILRVKHKQRQLSDAEFQSNKLKVIVIRQARKKHKPAFSFYAVKLCSCFSHFKKTHELRILKTNHSFVQILLLKPLLITIQGERPIIKENQNEIFSILKRLLLTKKRMVFFLRHY